MGRWLLFYFILSLMVSQNSLGQELYINDLYQGPNPIDGYVRVHVTDGGIIPDGVTFNNLHLSCDGGLIENLTGDFTGKDIDILAGEIENFSVLNAGSLTMSGGVISEDLINFAAPSIRITDGKISGDFNSFQLTTIDNIYLSGNLNAIFDAPRSGDLSRVTINGGQFRGDVKSFGGAQLIINDGVLIKDLFINVDEANAKLILNGGSIASGSIYVEGISDEEEQIEIHGSRLHFKQTGTNQGIITGVFNEFDNVGWIDGLPYYGDPKHLRIFSDSVENKPFIVLRDFIGSESQLDAISRSPAERIEITEGAMINGELFVNGKDVEIFGGVVESINADNIIVHGGEVDHADARDVTIYDGHIKTLVGDNRIGIQSGELDLVYPITSIVSMSGGVVHRFSEFYGVLSISGGEVFALGGPENGISVKGTAFIHSDVNLYDGGPCLIEGGVILGSLIYNYDGWGTFKMTGGLINEDVILGYSRDLGHEMSGGLILGELISDILEDEIGLLDSAKINFHANKIQYVHQEEQFGVIYGYFEDGQLIGGPDGLPFHGLPELLIFHTSLEWDQNLFIRSDPNQDGRTNIADIYATLNYLFRGISLECEAAADFDDNEIIDLSDVVQSLLFLYRGNSAPEAPFPSCGISSLDSPFSCETKGHCEQ